MIKNNGFFEIGIIQGKNTENLGMLWRSAYIMGANGIFTIGARYPKFDKTDTTQSEKHIPLREYDDFETFVKSIPRGVELVGVELDDRASDLTTFTHNKRSIYLLGAEDKGIPEEYLKKCNRIVKVPFDKVSLNVSITGTVIMYDRFLKK